jgi:hypothetical protein
MSEPRLSPPPPPGGTPPPAGGLPWEERERYGAVQGFVETLKLLITAPADAFARARRHGDLVSPLAYAVLVGWIGIVVAGLWRMAIGTSVLGMMPGQPRGAAGLALAFSGIRMVALLVLAPIFVLIALFVYGALLHLFLMLYGGTRNSEVGFEGTLRVLAWSTTAQVGELVPLVGGLVAMVWSIVLQTIGLAAFHRTSQGRALAAVLTPLLLCCICVGFFFAGAMALLFGAAAHAGR